MIELL